MSQTNKKLQFAASALLVSSLVPTLALSQQPTPTVDADRAALMEQAHQRCLRDLQPRRIQLRTYLARNRQGASHYDAAYRVRQQAAARAVNSSPIQRALDQIRFNMQRWQALQADARIALELSQPDQSRAHHDFQAALELERQTMSQIQSIRTLRRQGNFYVGISDFDAGDQRFGCFSLSNREIIGDSREHREPSIEEQTRAFTSARCGDLLYVAAYSGGADYSATYNIVTRQIQETDRSVTPTENRNELLQRVRQHFSDEFSTNRLLTGRDSLLSRCPDEVDAFLNEITASGNTAAGPAAGSPGNGEGNSAGATQDGAPAN